MNDREELLLHFSQVLGLVGREDKHLMAVKDRFFGQVESVDAAWLETILATPEGVDRLESFVGKFTRMQDTVMDKLVPLFLKIMGEPVGAAIDNLNRMEKLDFIQCADEWIELRYLRNRLVHEYMEDAEVMAMALGRARSLMEVMHQTYVLVRNKVDSVQVSSAI